MASKPIQQQSFTTIDESIKLTKKQNEILTMVGDLYEVEVAEFIKDALIESLKEEITDSDFCVLLPLNLMTRIDKVISHEVSGIGSYPFAG
jgi:hypothetical protein